MSKESYARGFCKKACDLGWNPVELAKFLKKKASDPFGEAGESLEGAMGSIGDYAEKNPIGGGALIGALAPAASSANLVGGVGSGVGASALSPLSIVTGPAGASSAASSGEDPASGSAVGSAAPAIAGAALVGAPTALAGGVAGSALSPVTAPVGASVGSSVASVQEAEKNDSAEFAERVRKEREAQMEKAWAEQKRRLGLIANGVK